MHGLQPCQFLTSNSSPVHWAKATKLQGRVVDKQPRFVKANAPGNQVIWSKNRTKVTGNSCCATHRSCGFGFLLPTQMSNICKHVSRGVLFTCVCVCMCLTSVDLDACVIALVGGKMVSAFGPSPIRDTEVTLAFRQQTSETNVMVMWFMFTKACVHVRVYVCYLGGLVRIAPVMREVMSDIQIDRLYVGSSLARAWTVPAQADHQGEENNDERLFDNRKMRLVVGPFKHDKVCV